MKSITRIRLASLIRRDAVKNETVLLSSGRESHYYVDCRAVTLQSEGAHTVATGVLEVLPDDVEAIGGMSLGADPIVGAVLALSGPLRRDALAGFLVRKGPKGHGLGKRVEGPLRRGSKVAVVEDVTTTGKSAYEAVEAAREMGCEVVLVVTVVDRMEGAAEFFAGKGIPFHPLLTVMDLGIEPFLKTYGNLGDARTP